ncbi:hypothetical protein [Moorena sp. SIO4A5]|uniref:hypothetical protein n=1 Tax=Moorena sp. SIO4A5 TaxID=2607838 RepID=UPI0013CA7875|nr:hypothetical protein [Moorena sp. SIO4A5]NEO21238.1 hypothetical protein [Moorena sp. SIO4A5]
MLIFNNKKNPPSSLLLLPGLYSLLPAPCSEVPAPYSLLPIPDSRFPIPDSRFPIPFYLNNVDVRFSSSSQSCSL